MYAIRSYYDEIGLIEKFSEQICIGQSYRGYKGCIGIGDCTKDFNTYLAGCPPKAEDVITSYSIHYTKLYDSIGNLGFL